MTFTWLAALVSRNGIVLAIGLGLIATFWTYDSLRVEAGRQEERAKTQEANRKAANVSDTVRNKSRNKRVRGKLDPNTID